MSIMKNFDTLITDLQQGDRFFYGQWYDFISLEHTNGYCKVTVTNGYSDKPHAIIIDAKEKVACTKTNHSEPLYKQATNVMKTITYYLPNLRLDIRGLAAKEIQVTVTATNPVDGKEYTKHAGWLSTTNTLHGGAKTPAYIVETAAKLLFENKQQLCDAIGHFASVNTDKLTHYYLQQRSGYWNREEVEMSSHFNSIEHTAGKDKWITPKHTAKI